MQFVTAEEILAARSVPWEEVFLPSLKKHAIVVGMSGKARDTFEASLVVGKGKGRSVKTDNIRARLAARCLFTAPPDKGGRRMFTDDQADALGDVRADILAPIYDVAQRLSGVSDDDVEELGNESATASSSSSPSS
jgi:hypothetical protein